MRTEAIMRTVNRAMWTPGRLSRDWLMRASFVLVGAIFVICQIIVSGARTQTERAAIAADRGQLDGGLECSADGNGRHASRLNYRRAARYLKSK